MVGAFVLAVYLSTVAPGIAGGDAGELVAESCHLGTAHPPGYPLFTLLNHVATRALPTLLDSVGLRPGPGVDGRSSPAWCANAAASVMGALAVVFTAQTINLICGRWSTNFQGRQNVHEAVVRRPCANNDRVFRSLAAGCAAMLMAFSPLMWQYSVTAEVFALNNFLLSLLCSLAVRFSFCRDLLHAAWGALIGGLALSNQHTAVLYVAPLSVWVIIQLVTSRCRLHATHPWRHLMAEIMLLVVLFLLGLTPYAYLPLAAKHASKPGSWGEVSTWSGLLHHLRRGDYGFLRLYSGGAGGGSSQGIVERVNAYYKNVLFVQGLGGVVLTLAVLGILSFCVEQGRAVPGVSETMAEEEHSEVASQQLDPSCGQTLNEAYEKCGLQSNMSGLLVETSVESTGNERRGSGIFGSNNDMQQPELTKGSRTVVEMLASWDDNGVSAPTALLTALATYVIVFHWLSNMPLNDPLLFGVHARFWMQPNILMFTFCGIGTYRAFDSIRLVPKSN